MASLDFESLSTNILFEETIKICYDSLYKNQELLSNINKNQFEKPLRTALCSNYFLFHVIVYQQVDGGSLGPPLSPSLANALLAHYEQIWLNDYPDEFMPVYYNRYVDDIFVLFRSPSHLEKFNEYLNTKHANIILTNEKEIKLSLPFLDVLISQSNKDFTTKVYHKLTFSGVYTNFNSFIADEYKHGLIFTFVFRIFLIVSDFSKFHKEVNYLKDVLKNNYFPTTLVDKCIKMFLNKQFAHKMVEHTVSKKELFLVLPYLGMSFFRLKTRLQKVSKSNISFCKIKIIFKSSVRLNNFFRFKDKMCLRSDIAYEFACGRCNATYYGETCRHFNVRVGEHSNISPLTKRIKNQRSKSKKINSC